MPFIEGFLTPVPAANKAAYAAHASEAAGLFRKLGATRLVEAWGDDVPDGKLNDLKKAVALKDDEVVLFSWLEYPDKATRDSANAALMADPSMMTGEMPFDGKRMIWAGFDPIVEVGEGPGGYVDGYVIPVPEANKEAFRAMAETHAGTFRRHGALRIVECWGVDTRDGTVTDYHRATLKQPDEAVVYAWIEWPDKATRDAAWEKIRAEPPMTSPEEMPFDGQRMMWGGFAPIVDSHA